MTQELAVEERREAEPVAVPSPPDVNATADGGPHEVGAVGGGQPSGAPEQRSFSYADLRRPFTAAAMKWKVQSSYGQNGSLIVGYIDARLVIDRLNLIVGHDWSDDYEALPSGLMICRLTVEGVTRMDVGTPINNQPKGVYSDAFKRAAVKFGIGLPVYSIPKIVLEVGKGLKEVGQQKKTRIITVGGLKSCAEQYQAWLDEHGSKSFGEPIDHGDISDSVGDLLEDPAPEDEQTTNDLPDAPQPLTDEKADQLRAHCRAIHAGLPKSKLPKARFETELRQASLSHEGLEAFATKLEGLA